MNIIGLASDHAGYQFKCLILDYLKSKGFEILDYGCNSSDSCDYADFAHLLGFGLDNEQIQCGLVFCGSGNGINMSINKHRSVRSALCWNSEIAFLARHHNDANVCAIPSRYISIEEAILIIDVFLSESFDGERHQKRIEKIPIIL